MRDFISFFVNGQPQQVRGHDAFLTLSDYLRMRLGLVGTKIVCSEGDCGSCSVLCGFPTSQSASQPAALQGQTGQQNGQPNRFRYRSIDSCIRFVFQLDGTHIVTVEGLGCDGQLNGVQQAMIDCHGSQCGFCTPGFVVAMTGLIQQQRETTGASTELSVDEIRHGLTGNLCRCTGYTPIINAALESEAARHTDINLQYSAEDLDSQLAGQGGIAILAEPTATIGQRQVFCPSSIQETVEILRDFPDAKIVAGATDVGVQFNKGHLSSATTFIDLNRVNELGSVSIDDNTIVAGCRATWAEIEDVIHSHAPQFKEIVSVFGSPQIRHVGTLGGNIINASPIADSGPFLFVCDAVLTLRSAGGERAVNINDFYLGYKQFDLQPGELLTRIDIPLPANVQAVRLYKITRRRDLDISTFTAAISIESKGDVISSAKIAYGAVGPTVLRMKKTESFLVGKPFSLESMQAAGEVAVSEITPLTDVRGSSEYRFSLARNVLQKYFHESRPVAV